MALRSDVGQRRSRHPRQTPAQGWSEWDTRRLDNGRRHTVLVDRLPLLPKAHLLYFSGWDDSGVGVFSFLDAVDDQIAVREARVWDPNRHGQIPRAAS